MCGRFVIAKELGFIAEAFEVAEFNQSQDFRSYNIAPSTQVPIIIEREIDGLPSREIHSARWGLVPSWAKEISGTPLFNARIETVLEKPSFKEAALVKRCAIPASGYFEWQSVGDTKEPFYIYPEESMLAFAGIYWWWRDPSKPATDPSRWQLTATIFSKVSAPNLSFIHDRSPVMLSPENISAWLAPDYETSQELLDALSEESDLVAQDLSYHKVNRAIGSVSENTARNIEEI
jgi:putative SOS response-associated peptidase YedK